MIQKMTKFDKDVLELYVKYRETELFHLNEPDVGVFIAESPNVIGRALRAGYEVLSVLMEESYPKEENQEQTEDVLSLVPEEVPIYTLPSEELEKEIKGFSMTRGMLAIFRRKPMQTLEEICEGKRRIVVLENVMNPTNVGAIFRNAAALHMDAVVLTKGSADPLYKRAARVSMGTVFQIPWTVISQNTVDMDALHALKYKTVAMALTEDSIDLTDPKLKEEERLAILMGTESAGLQRETVTKSDYRVKIPMREGVDSLNVAAASAVACWELGKED
ncbi:tRNA G18 (ribose-2'-O)-methylase SpoU [Lachnospiraceae bacterium A10]|nr:tRNA G18 (ribose-2'-O)-methylase SpoU [Lachnospiraceae bacterium A10]